MICLFFRQARLLKFVARMHPLPSISARIRNKGDARAQHYLPLRGRQYAADDGEKRFFLQGWGLNSQHPSTFIGFALQI